jgi:hypothetical protein
MQNKIKPDNLELADHIAELELLLLSNNNIFIVEGKSDLDFFKIPLKSTKKKILPFVIGEKGSTNCRNDIIELFNNVSSIQNNPKVLAIIDKDLIENEIPNYNNLIQTELCDLDCYYVFCSNFFNFVVQLTDNEKINKALGFTPIDNINGFREFLLRALLPLTKMRLINSDIKIPFNKLLKKSPVEQRKERYKKFNKFLDKQYFIDLDLFYRYLVTNTGYNNVNLLNLKHKLDEINIENLINVTNGHDLISLVTVIIKIANPDYDDIKTEKALRLSMNIDIYSEYEFTNIVKNWILSTEDLLQLNALA